MQTTRRLLQCNTEPTRYYYSVSLLLNASVKKGEYYYYFFKHSRTPTNCANDATFPAHPQQGVFKRTLGCSFISNGLGDAAKHADLQPVCTRLITPIGVNTHWMARAQPQGQNAVSVLTGASITGICSFNPASCP